MKRLTSVLLALAISLILAPAAQADPIASSDNYTLGLNTVGATAGGQASILLYLLEDSSGNVTSASGTVTFYTKITVNHVTQIVTDTEDITGLVTGKTYEELYGVKNTGTGTTVAGGFDQKNSTISPYLDSYGLALTLGNGDDLQIWTYTNLGTELLYVDDETWDSAGESYTRSTFSEPTSDLHEFAPEPGTLTLFGTGLLGLAGLVRRKYAQSR
jgi:hypothetical protein